MKKGNIAFFIFFIYGFSHTMYDFLDKLKKKIIPLKSEEQRFIEVLDETYRLKYSNFAQFLEENPSWASKIDPFMRILYLNELIDKKDNTNIVRLIKAGFSPDLFDYYGRPLLVRAILNHSPETVKTLLRCGADPNKVDKWRLSPLYYACIIRKKNLIKLLVDAGAVIDTPSLNTLLRSKSYTDIVSYLWRLVGENPILAASMGLLSVHNPPVCIDFTLCFSRSLTGKVTPLRALLTQNNIHLVVNVFKKLVQELEISRDKKTAIAVFAILKYPTHTNKTIIELGKNFMFNEHGGVRDFLFKKL